MRLFYIARVGALFGGRNGGKKGRDLRNKGELVDKTRGRSIRDENRLTTKGTRGTKEIFLATTVRYLIVRGTNDCLSVKLRQCIDLDKAVRSHSWISIQD